MPRTVRLVLGIVAILIGLIWFFQGIGMIEGSFMTGEPVWTVIGAALIVLGAGLLVRGRAARG